jgi:hypothetical protein
MMTRWLLLGVTLILLGCGAAMSPLVHAGLANVLPPGKPGDPLADPRFVAASFGQAFVILGIVFLCLDLRMQPASRSIWAVLARTYLFLILAAFGIVWTIVIQFSVVFGAFLARAAERM